MTDSIFVKGSKNLRFLLIRQKKIKKEYHPIPDKVKFAKPIQLEEFME